MERAKATGGPERVQAGEVRRWQGGKDANRGGKIMAERNGGKGQRKVARETAGHAGHVAKQDTLQPYVHKAETRT